MLRAWVNMSPQITMQALSWFCLFIGLWKIFASTLPNGITEIAQLSSLRLLNKCIAEIRILWRVSSFLPLYLHTHTHTADSAAPI